MKFTAWLSTKTSCTRASCRMSRTLAVSALVKNQLSPSYSTSPLLDIGRVLTPCGPTVCIMQKSIWPMVLATSLNSWLRCMCAPVEG